MTDAKERRDGYYKWAREQFMEFVEDYDVPDIDWIRTLITEYDPSFSHMRRYGVFSTMRKRLILRKMRYTTVSFRVSMGDQSIIYAYAYMLPKKQVIRSTDWKHNFFRSKTWDYQYFVTGPSLKSQDGEYRQGFVTSLSLYNAMTSDEKLFNEIQSWIIDKIDRKDWKITNEIFSAEADEEDINKQLMRDRMALNLLTYTWTAEMYYFIINMQHNNINLRYNAIMFDQDDRSYFLRLIADYGIIPLRDLKRFVRRIYWSPEVKKSTYKAGQKLMTLKDKHLKELFNIKHGPWRELYVAKRVGEIVLNMISPSFMLTAGWFLIQDARPEILDNEEVWKHTNKLNVMLCTVNEYVEYTIYDVPRMLTSSQYAERIGNIKKEPAVLAKYVFETLYALYCMNEHCGVIHSDLHLNNLTIYNYFFLSDYIKNKHEDGYPVNIYEIGDRSYIFEHIGAYACIIDFSRALIHPDRLKDDFDADIIEEFHTSQKEQIVHLYYEIFPEFMKLNGQKFKMAIEKNFDDLFSLLRAIDIYVFASKLKMHMGTFHDNSKENIILLDSVEKTARSYLENQMNYLINFGKLESKMNPNLDIINKHFSKYRVSGGIPSYMPKNKRPILSNIFRADRKLKYSGNQWETFPPLSGNSYAYINGKLEQIEAERDETYEKTLKVLKEEQQEVLDEIEKLQET